MNESLGRAPHLLSDAPLDRILDNEDFARGKPVVDALFSHLEQYFFERQRHRGQGFCIGLFGGLGQGKTTIVQSLEARMRRANFNIGFLGDGLGYNPVFTWFVASDYSTTELDAELDRCLSQMLWTWRVLVTAVVFGVGYLAINVVSALAEKANWLHSPASLASMVIVALTLLGAGVNFLFPKFLRQLERWMHFGAHRRRRFRLRRADVLVIDDLDRATVDQQRALLRSLYRYSAQFNCAVIVCLDETQLLASPPTPDAPEELLRKAIAVECRMPNRTDDDGPFLAMALTSKAAQLNPHIDWLRDPVFLADFSRVCALLPRTGPRQIKRLLNDLLWAMHQIGSRDSLSASALLRANGLAYFVPALRTQATSFINLLQENNTGRFGEFLRTLEVSVATTPSNTAHIAAAIRLFAATRALLPESGDWRQAIAVWPNQVSRGAMPCASPEVESKAEIAIPLPLTYDEVAGLSKTFRLIAQGYGDAQFYDRSLTLAVNPKNASEIPHEQSWLICQSLFANLPTNDRWRLYAFWQRLRATTLGTSPVTTFSSLPFALYRAMFADADVVALTTSDQIASWLQALNDDAQCARVSPQERFHLLGLLPEVPGAAALSALLGTGFGGTDDDLVRQAMRTARWDLEPVPTSVAALVKDFSHTSADKAMRYWSAARERPDSTFWKDLATQCAWVHRIWQAGITGFPPAIAAALLETPQTLPQDSFADLTAYMDCWQALLNSETSRQVSPLLHLKENTRFLPMEYAKRVEQLCEHSCVKNLPEVQLRALIVLALVFSPIDALKSLFRRMHDEGRRLPPLGDWQLVAAPGFTGVMKALFASWVDPEQVRNLLAGVAGWPTNRQADDARLLISMALERERPNDGADLVSEFNLPFPTEL